MPPVQEWLKKLGLAHELSVTRQGSSDSFRVEVRSHQAADKATPADIGYGFSQVVPVVVQCAYAEQDSTLLFEQPEIHLHPTAQSRLGGFFADAVRRVPSTYVIETHSRFLLSGLQEAVRLRKLRSRDVIVYAVRSQSGVASLRSFKIDAGGDLWDAWERGFPDPWD